MFAVLIVLIAAVVLMLVMACLNVAAEADKTLAVISPKSGPTPTPEPTPEPIPEDVYLLAKIMKCEAGINWPDWATMLIGEVVMNRVASPRFPNTIKEVIYADNPVQYEPVYSSGWDEVIPDDDYIQLAQRLIDGERPLGDEDVVFQALFPQGTGTIVTFYDRELKTITYFCKG